MTEKYTLMISEKPDAMRRIAEALAEGKSLKRRVNEKDVAYYEFKKDGKKHVIVCAVGHLFNLDPVDKGKGWTYPIFEAEWKPSFAVRKESEFSRKYFEVVEQMAKNANSYIVCTDFDTEGCLPFNEKILIKENGIIKLEKIGDLVERKFKNHQTKKWGEFTYVEPSDISISLMDDKFRLKFGKIKKMMKRKGDKKLLEITTEHGRKVIVSKNHPFFVLSKFGLNLKKADELKIGEYLPIAKELPFCEPKIEEIDLIEECSKLPNDFYIYGIKNVIKLTPAEMSKILGVKRKACSGWRFSNRLPLWAYLKLETKKSDRTKLKIGVRKSKIKVPAIIRFDGNLGKLIGYYLAEGCVDSSGFVGLYFGPHEKHLVDETENLFREVFQANKIKKRLRKTRGSLGKGFSYEIGTKVRIISILFQKILNLGSNAYEKRLPQAIFSMPIEFITNLIDAYLLGDGSIFIDSKDNRIVISAASVSKDLIDGLQLLLLSLGISSSLVKGNRKNIHYLYFTLDGIKKLLKFKIFGLLKRNDLIDRINDFSEYTARDPINLLPNFLLEGCKLSEWASNNVRHTERTSALSILEKTPLVKSILKGGIHFLRIRKIEEVNYDGFLYDVETETGSFMHGNGIITHNSVIGFNVLKFLCGVGDGGRMKFSTLTKDELVDSYKNMSKHLDFGQIEAGLTRHQLDWLWGINLTRALTLALKNHAQKGFAILSSGRVQSPTLAILLEKELEIRKFKPTPFWQLELHCKLDGKEVIAGYEKEKIWKKEEADRVLESSKGKDAVVKDIKKKQYKQSPPYPFNTTDLQAESYSQFKFSPTQTNGIAESLYQQGIISYPRSSSQKLPSSINYEKILRALASIPQYKELAEEILAKAKLIPHEGPREDPAHPAVYPTSEVADLKKLNAQQKKLYDLIIRRFLSVFADEALRESMNVFLDVNGNKFIIVGKRTIEPGWTKFYEPYLAFEEQILPELKIGQVIKVLKIEQLTKETQPPGRYSQGSILKELEKRNLGTKATRAEILQTLYDRRYIFGKSIQVTKLGEAVTKALKEYSPRILSEELTVHFEKEMDQVFNGKKKREEVVEEAKETLVDILKEFKKNEKKIGKKLLEGLQEARKEERHIGTCPKCKTGELRIIYSRKTGKRFIGCSNYPKCHNGYPIPLVGQITALGKNCEVCGLPMIQVWRKGSRPFRMCINNKCKTKENWGKKKRPAAKAEEVKKTEEVKK